MDHSQVFSHERWRPITMALNLIVLITISSLAAKRTPDSIAKWRAISVTNLAVCLTLVDSLIYVALATFVTFGLGTSRSLGVCSFAYFLCAFFYCAAKLTTAWFLIERARLVTAPLVPRLQNKLYLFNFGLSTMWFAALTLMLVFRESKIRSPDGECLISMGAGPAGAMIGIDAFLNIYYTSLFAVPLLRGKWKNPKLKQLAVKSALAAMLTVSSSVANLGLLAAHHGTELSWVCLATCTLDTVWCACVLCALTGKRDDDEASEAAPTQGDIHTSFLWRRTAEGHKSASGQGSNPFSPALVAGTDSSAAASSPRAFEHAPLAAWGTFGRIELGEGNALGGGGGGRRGSAAPDEMCLGAVNERKAVDGAWKAPSPKQEESEEEEKEEAEAAPVPHVEFAVLAREYSAGGGVAGADGGREV